MPTRYIRVDYKTAISRVSRKYNNFDTKHKISQVIGCATAGVIITTATTTTTIIMISHHSRLVGQMVPRDILSPLTKALFRLWLGGAYGSKGRCIIRQLSAETIAGNHGDRGNHRREAAAGGVLYIIIHYENPERFDLRSFFFF